MLKLYNTLSRKKDIFKGRGTLRQAQGKKRVNLFVCGPTVYDSPHLGHARTYIVFDAFVKYLRQKGLNVFYLQNITDIDDKIIKRAREENVLWKTLARKFEKEYLRDMAAIGVNSVSKYARATGHIKEIISQTQRLMKKGYGYQLEDGVYFDVAKFKEYGKLSRRTAEQAEDGVSRIDDTKGKKNKSDFCLWKLARSDSEGQVLSGAEGQGEPKWPSIFGQGRPGWHIEDTAITEKFFGPQYDIHGGGRDLIFPHHEAEITQMEAISGKKPLAKYWLHTGFLTIEGAKMSKSLGNFITINDFLQNHSPRLLRLFVLSSLYRSPLDYSQKKVEQTQNQLERIDEFVDKLKTPAYAIRASAGKPSSPAGKQNAKLIKDLLAKTEKDFGKAMDDDFNTPLALAAVFELITEGNKLLAANKIDGASAKKILAFLKKIDHVFGFIFPAKKTATIMPAAVKQLTKQREKARQEKNWKEADRLRLELQNRGYSVEDTPDGPKLKKL